MNWGKALPPKTHVSVHQYTQMGDKVSMCKKYGKGLMGKTRSLHICELIRRKTVICHECGKSFIMKNNVCILQQTHTVEKPSHVIKVVKALGRRHASCNFRDFTWERSPMNELNVGKPSLQTQDYVHQIKHRKEALRVQ